MPRLGFHEPVLLQEVLERLPAEAKTMMDGTLGHGGHSEAIAEKFPGSLKIVGIDKDSMMLAKARERLRVKSDQLVFIQRSYADFPNIVSKSSIDQFDAILLDIGVNMEHFKDASRGFSIKQDGPLDMRFDQSKGLRAGELLATCSTESFRQMLVQWTDFSEKWIVHLTTSFFASNRIFETTQELRQWAKSIGMNDKALAVRFQAIRIVVNGELDEFALFLERFVHYLAPGGRCIILTYHSIEDRMAKNAFKALEESGQTKILTKHVITPKRAEKESNPAARSAKMRVLEKI